MLLSCDDAWFGGRRGPSILRIEAGRLSWAGPAGSGQSGQNSQTWHGTDVEAHIAATVLPPFTDSHVHLGLIDPTRLVAGGIGRVVDLGWDPATAKTWRGRPDPWPEVSIAGGLLGPPGGYPSRSTWAPPAAAIPVADDDDAARAVASMQEAGASLVTITLNAEAGPVWDDRLLDRVVAAAHARGLPVVAHAQGIGQVRRASRARVDALAHTPWTERLDDDLLDDVARTMTWISTLDIHGSGIGSDDRDGSRNRDLDVALDNLARFHQRSGTVLYGTDLGNPRLPVGLNGRELAALAEAGLDLAAILGSLTPGSGEDGFDTRLVTVVAGRLDGIEALARAEILTLPELVGRAE